MELFDTNGTQNISASNRPNTFAFPNGILTIELNSEGMDMRKGTVSKDKEMIYCIGKIGLHNIAAFVG